MHWLTVNLASTKPLVLAIDDLHWCDTASLRYLAYLVRRLDGLTVLIVGTLRTGEQHDDEQLLGELLLDPVTVAVQAAPLTEEATAGMVSGRLGPTAALFTRACHRTTLGNPLLLRQLLRALQTEGVRPGAAHADTVIAVGSRAVSSMVLMRLRRMPPDVTVVARLSRSLERAPNCPCGRLHRADREPHRRSARRADPVRGAQGRAAAGIRPSAGPRRRLPRRPGRRTGELQHEREARVLHRLDAPPERVAAHLLLAPCRGVRTRLSATRRAVDPDGRFLAPHESATGQ